MDVRIGVSQTAKELEIELPADADAAAIRKDLETAVSKGTTFWVTDKRGRQVGVPAEKIAYVEIGSPDEHRRIGFGG
ncbi:MAG: DUF3107 domain-containing protein [Acidimicrobiales bacterium]|nr:DUF3107 domain-containing protein [Acidimicrobiales bacterium]